MKVLTIIDMQDCFLHRNDVRKCIGPIQKLIGRFKELGWPMLLVEMKKRGRSIRCIRNRVHAWTRKDYTDGSHNIVKRCRREGWPLDFVLCGVYRDICVHRTALGLNRLGDVTVILNATRPFKGYPPDKWPDEIKFSAVGRFMRSTASQLS